ncbi:MAG: hypothetical protein PHF17_08445 [Arcobacteraceae bacterium]|nr:hypothetical protein [Arcobacteraceae bacterium]
MRITINEEDLQGIISFLKKHNKNEYVSILESEFENNKSRDITNKQKSILEARKERTNKLKEKIENAMNLLRLENKEITAYSVSKVADISYNSARKYLDI